MPQTKQLVVALGAVTLLALVGLTQIPTAPPSSTSAAAVLFGDSAAPVTVEELTVSTKQDARERMIAQLRAGGGAVIEEAQGSFPEAAPTEDVEEISTPETGVTDQCVTGENQDSGCVSTAQTGAIESVWLGLAADGTIVFSDSEGGQTVSAASLDTCGGHEHPTLWEGQVVTLYHYHALDGSLASVGCLPLPTAVATPSPIGADGATTTVE